MTIIEKQIATVKQKFEEVKSNTSETRKQITDKLSELMKYSSRYEESWDGGWFRDDYKVYRYNFDTSSDEFMNVDENKIKEDIKKLSGIDISELRDQLTPLSQSFFELRDFIVAELSFINGNGAFKPEEELLKQIQNFKWGVLPGEFIKLKRPKEFFSHDPSVINNSNQVPPHIAVADEELYIFHLVQSYNSFEKLTHKLIRQFEIKSSTDSKENIETNFQQDALLSLIDRFHLVATQLKIRYKNRETLTIKDEYDVQDLMHALLKMNFENIKKEEYTPSYAGSSSRIDFLLKREKISIEVKKTRPTLKDKEIGEQLILDIMHYKMHQECKRLI